MKALYKVFDVRLINERTSLCIDIYFMDANGKVAQDTLHVDITGLLTLSAVRSAMSTQGIALASAKGFTLVASDFINLNSV